MCVLYSQLPLFQLNKALKTLVRPVLERSISDLILPVVERSIKIALTTCESVVKKVGGSIHLFYPHLFCCENCIIRLNLFLTVLGNNILS